MQQESHINNGLYFSRINPSIPEIPIYSSKPIPCFKPFKSWHWRQDVMSIGNHSVVSRNHIQQVYRRPITDTKLTICKNPPCLFYDSGGNTHPENQQL
jgi:hypothetical protein